MKGDDKRVFVSSSVRVTPQKGIISIYQHLEEVNRVGMQASSFQEPEDEKAYSFSQDVLQDEKPSFLCICTALSTGEQ